jgi:YVTN family beta-propeller protein
VEFRILGPLDLVGGADGAPIEAPKLRALLGVLLLHPNEVVSNERLIDELWGDRPPATAGKTLQTYISQLRRGLRPDVIVTRPPGYLLQIESGELDAERFRALVAKASNLAARSDNRQARDRYREALALWRGPPLADVRFESFARNEVAQLNEERLSAVLELIDCELALGHHERVVLELKTLVRQHPLRERPRAQLMLALYRCGRQADALAAYQEARRVLVEELGLEPGSELQELEHAILAHDPTLEAPPRAASPQPVSRRLLSPRALAFATLAALAAALGVTLALRGREARSLQLVSNSIGFVDAGSGRLTRSFQVGRQPIALTVANKSVWVANYTDQTVTRIDRATGDIATIPVGGHPTGLAAYRGIVWVWTLEDKLVPIDPRFDTPGHPLSLAKETLASRSQGQAGRTPEERQGGRLAAGGGFLWITAPLTTVVRLDVADRRNRVPIVPDAGVEGAIVYRDGQAWVAGTDQVFPITGSRPISGSGVPVGVVHDLVFGAGSLWVVSGGPTDPGGVAGGLRRIDPTTRLVRATIDVGSDPVAAAVAGGSVWVAARTDGMIVRVELEDGRKIERIRVGAKPIAVAADHGGVWVAVD